MASWVYNKGLEELVDGTITYVSDALIKVMLTSVEVATYVPNRDDDVADAGGASDPTDAETNVDNYTRGWNGAGRKVLLSKTLLEDTVNDRIEYIAADLDTGAGNQWTTLGGTTDETLDYAIVIKEVAASNDTTTRLLALIDPANQLTNGSDIELVFDASGVFYLDTNP